MVEVGLYMSLNQRHVFVYKEAEVKRSISKPPSDTNVFKTKPISWKENTKTQSIKREAITKQKKN